MAKNRRKVSAKMHEQFTIVSGTFLEIGYILGNLILFVCFDCHPIYHKL
jgi:hypothetical protein